MKVPTPTILFAKLKTECARKHVLGTSKENNREYSEQMLAVNVGQLLALVSADGQVGVRAKRSDRLILRRRLVVLPMRPLQVAYPHPSTGIISTMRLNFVKNRTTYFQKEFHRGFIAKCK